MTTKGEVAGTGDKRNPLEELRSLRIDREPAKVKVGSTSRAWLGWILVLALLGLGVYFGWRPALGYYRERTAPPPETTLVVRSGGPRTVLTASGYVNADAIVVVGATIGGRLKTVLVQKGDRVKRGQLLALLEDDQLRAELGFARANFARDERNLKRHEALARSDATTQELLDNARSQAAADRASVDLAEARLRQTRILSPIDGKVLERMVEPGVVVTPTLQTSIVKLADMRKTVVEVDVSESDLGKLVIAQPVHVVLDAYPDHPYKGTLREFAQVADRAKATVQAKVFLDDPDDRVRPGMSAKVTFRPPGTETPAEPGKILLPPNALLSGQQAVYVLQGNQVVRKGVRVRTDKDSAMLEVLSGLNEGERVVIGGQERLSEGQRVGAKSE